MRIGCGFGEAESITTSTASAACCVVEGAALPFEDDVPAGVSDEGNRVRWLNRNGRLWSLREGRRGDAVQQSDARDRSETARRAHMLTGLPSRSVHWSCTINGGLSGSRESTLEPNSAEPVGCWTTVRT